MRYPVDNWAALRRGYRFGQPTFYSPFHLGLDLIIPTGTPVYMPADGAVGNQPNTPAGGNIAIATIGDRVVRFLHLSRFGKSGMVKEGEVIGWSGNTGLSQGPHIHIDVSKKPFNLNDRKNFIDPESYFKGESVPQPFWQTTPPDKLLAHINACHDAEVAVTGRLFDPMAEHWKRSQNRTEVVWGAVINGMIDSNEVDKWLQFLTPEMRQKLKGKL